MLRLSCLRPLALVSLLACSNDPDVEDSPVPPPFGAGGFGASGASGQAGGPGGPGGPGDAGGAGGSAAGGAGAAGSVAGGSGQGGAAGAGMSGSSGQAGAAGGSAGGGVGGSAGAGGAGEAGAAGEAGQAGDGAGGSGGDASDVGGAGPGGQGGDGGGGGGGEPEANVAFVTSGTFAPSDGVAAADALCADLAEKAGLTGTYLAWLSTSQQDARSRFGNARGWRRVDGLPFADSIETLTAGAVFYPLRIDESGNDVGQGQAVITGTKPDGTAAALTCSDWTSSKTTHVAGDAASGTSTWTQRPTAALTLKCSESARVYCLQTDHTTTVAPDPLPDDARRIFITSAAFLVAGGLAAADKACHDEAQGAGLPGEYVALLASKSSSLAARVPVDERPWFRPDGVQVADADQPLAEAFADLLAAPVVTASGGYSTASAWAASASLAAAATATCGDWAGGAKNATAFRSEAGPTDGAWFSNASSLCTATDNRLHCVEK